MSLLNIRDLKKSYSSPDGTKMPIVDVPQFSLDARQQVALQGGSGTGKTTFLNLIAGILQPDAGLIEIAGESMSGASESKRDQLRARSIGYVFQTFNLLQGYSALENVELGMMFGPGRDRKKAAALLDRMGLSDRMHYRPRQLSVGQQQRVAVARALANHPKLVLADEPTGNLDTARAGEALALIRDVCREQEASLLLVSHDPAVLSQFSEVRKLEEINHAISGQPAVEVLA